MKGRGKHRRGYTFSCKIYWCGLILVFNMPLHTVKLFYTIQKITSQVNSLVISSTFQPNSLFIFVYCPQTLYQKRKTAKLNA